MREPSRADAVVYLRKLLLSRLPVSVPLKKQSVYQGRRAGTRWIVIDVVDYRFREGKTLKLEAF